MKVKILQRSWKLISSHGPSLPVNSPAQNRILHVDLWRSKELYNLLWPLQLLPVVKVDGCTGTDLVLLYTYFNHHWWRCCSYLSPTLFIVSHNSPGSPSYCQNFLLAVDSCMMTCDEAMVFFRDTEWHGISQWSLRNINQLERQRMHCWRGHLVCHDRLESCQIRLWCHCL